MKIKNWTFEEHTQIALFGNLQRLHSKEKWSEMAAFGVSSKAKK